jgi:hypothetical protein
MRRFGKRTLEAVEQMKRRELTPAREWRRYANRVMGYVSTKSSAVAIVAAVFVWLEVPQVSGSIHLYLIVLGFFAALAAAYLVASLTHLRNWPAQPMFLWAQGPRPNWNPDDDKEGLVPRVNKAIEQGRDEHSWRDARNLAEQLPDDIRRVHALAMINVFEKGLFDEDAYQAAIAEVKDEAESRYWRVQLAVARSFAAHLAGDDYMASLLAAAKSEGRFALPMQSRVRILVARVGLSVAFLAIGVFASVPLAMTSGR